MSIPLSQLGHSDWVTSNNITAAWGHLAKHDYIYQLYHNISGKSWLILDVNLIQPTQQDLYHWKQIYLLIFTTKSIKEPY